MYAHLLALYRANPREGKVLSFMITAFLLIYFLPAGTERFDNAVLEAFRLTNWYAREHVILCLLPAFLIAGAMAAYLSQDAVMRYLGPDASKPVAFSVASVSGTLLAVCSCTVLPLFGGILMMPNLKRVSVPLLFITLLKLIQSKDGDVLMRCY